MYTSRSRRCPALSTGEGASDWVEEAYRDLDAMVVREGSGWRVVEEALRGGSGGGDSALPLPLSREYGGGGDSEDEAMGDDVNGANGTERITVYVVPFGIHEKQHVG